MHENQAVRFGIKGPAFFGIWTLQVWIYWINTHNVHLPAAIPWQSIYVTLSLCLLALAFLFRKRKADDANRPREAMFDRICAVAMGMCTLAIEPCGLDIGTPAAALAGTLVGGALLGWTYVRWGWLYSKLPLTSSVYCLFVSALFAVVGKAVLALLPAEAAATISALLPAVGMAMLARARKEISPSAMGQGRILYKHDSILSFRKVGAVFFVFSLVMAALVLFIDPHRSAGGATIVASRIIEFVLALAVLWLVLREKRGLRFSSLWRFLFLYLATALALETYVPSNGFAQPVIIASTDIVVLFVWLTIADISHHCEDHPYAVFGLGWCAYSIPYALTVVVAPLYPFACDETLLSFTLLLVMAITASFCLESRDRDTALIFADLRNDESAPEEYSNLDERCLVLGKKKGLTPREIEVMQLLCRGNSKSYIAEKLYVTENTVKGHTKHIYQKLDVHSKSELQALVGL